MTRKLLIALCILCVALGAAAAYSLVRLSRVEEAWEHTQAELEQARREREAQENSFATLLAERDQQIKALRGTEREYTRLKNEVVKVLEEKLSSREKEREAAGAEIERLTRSLAETKAQQERLSEQLKEQIKLRDELLPKLKEAESAAAELRKQLKEAQQARTEAEEKLAVALGELKKVKTDLKKLERLAPAVAGRKIGGTVTSVNPESNTCIVGDFNELPEVGLELSVFRGSEFVARARVYRVFEKYAGARITFLQPGEGVKVGDTVRSGFEVARSKAQ